MQNGSTRFGVYTAQGLYLAGVNWAEPDQAATITGDKAQAVSMGRGVAVQVIGYLRRCGISCWLVAL